MACRFGKLCGAIPLCEHIHQNIGHMCKRVGLLFLCRALICAATTCGEECGGGGEGGEEIGQHCINCVVQNLIDHPLGVVDVLNVQDGLCCEIVIIVGELCNEQLIHNSQKSICEWGVVVCNVSLVVVIPRGVVSRCISIMHVVRGNICGVVVVIRQFCDELQIQVNCGVCHAGEGVDGEVGEDALHKLLEGVCAEDVWGVLCDEVVEWGLE